MLIITITIITIRRKNEGKKRTIIIVSISSEFHSGLVPHFSAPRLKIFPWKKFLIFFLKTTALKSVLQFLKKKIIKIFQVQLQDFCLRNISHIMAHFPNPVSKFSTEKNFWYFFQKTPPQINLLYFPKKPLTLFSPILNNFPWKKNYIFSMKTQPFKNFFYFSQGNSPTVWDDCWWSHTHTQKRKVAKQNKAKKSLLLWDDCWLIVKLKKICILEWLPIKIFWKFYDPLFAMVKWKQ